MKTALQVFCIIVVSLGILVEYLTGGTLGHTLITSGALAFAISAKIGRKYYGKTQKEKSLTP